MKKLTAVLLGLVILFSMSPSKVSAAGTGALFKVYPDTGYVKPNETFIVDVLIDSGPSSVTLARAVLTYDPTLVQVVKAEKNNTLFCTWPEDQQTVDNKNGVLMLTGFCQSGSSQLYKTAGDPDVFGRITFQAKKAGNLKLDWEYTGEDQPFKTVIMEEGSPPQNALSTKPNPGNYVISVTTTQVPPPVAGIFDEKEILIGASILVLGIVSFVAGGYFMGFYKRRISKNVRTVVVTD